MTKCRVCGKVYDAAMCPRCGFPDIQAPANAPADYWEKLQPMIISHREEFLKQVQLQIPIYRWKDQNGTVVEDRVELLDVCTAAQAKAAERWIPEKFARIPDEKTIPVTVRITACGDTWERSIPVPNLHKPELQQLGIEIDADYNILLKLKNDTEGNTVSEPVPLLDL